MLSLHPPIELAEGLEQHKPGVEHGGVSFSARNTTNGNAEVLADGQTYRLPRVQAGSGVRYFDGQVEYREHGSEAMLNGARGGPYDNCRS